MTQFSKNVNIFKKCHNVQNVTGSNVIEKLSFKRVYSVTQCQHFDALEENTFF